MQQHDDHQHADGNGHMVTYAHYVRIWLGLLALTAITVALAGIDLGRWVIITALVIASIKSALVLNIFMHLRFEEKTFKVFVAIAIATLTIFIGMTFFDYAFV